MYKGTISIGDIHKKTIKLLNIQKLVDYSKKNKISKKLDEMSRNMPMFRLAIKSDANVKPCCVGFGEKINLCNIYESRLSDIWISKLMRVCKKFIPRKKLIKTKFVKSI